MNLKGWKKAFTLSEVFISMIILSILVAVSIHAFSSNRKDYSREYLYYTAYQTIVKVIDNALMNNDYLNKTSNQLPDGMFAASGGYNYMIVNTVPCGYKNKPMACHAFTPATNLCTVFAAYLNTSEENPCSDNKIIVNNGMEFTFNYDNAAFSNRDNLKYVSAQAGGAASIFDSPYLLALGPQSGAGYDEDIDDGLGDGGDSGGTSAPYVKGPTITGNMNESNNDNTQWNVENIAAKIKVDIDGSDKGANIAGYDIVEFMVTLSGKVIPMYTRINADMREYTQNGDGICNAGGTSGCEAGGNNALMAFDVVYTDPQTNLLKVINEGRSVSFPEAACMAGYISDGTAYCDGFKYNSLTGEERANGVGLAPECDPDDSAYIAGGDCYIRLVEKMKWTK